MPPVVILGPLVLLLLLLLLFLSSLRNNNDNRPPVIAGCARLAKSSLGRPYVNVTSLLEAAETATIFEGQLYGANNGTIKEELIWRLSDY